MTDTILENAIEEVKETIRQEELESNADFWRNQAELLQMELTLVKFSNRDLKVIIFIEAVILGVIFVKII